MLDNRLNPSDLGRNMMQLLVFILPEMGFETVV